MTEPEPRSAMTEPRGEGAPDPHPVTEASSASAVPVDAGPGLEVAAISDRGPVREQNQDVWEVRPLPGGCLLVLADGMGGERAGLEAARAAVSGALAVRASLDQPRAALEAMVGAASAAVDEVRRSAGGRPGTTLVIAAVRVGHATVANVGDSRAYLIRDGTASPVTADHTWTGDQVAAGLMTPAVARHDGRRNILTRAVLGDPVLPDLFPLELAAGDVLLLCSDGLWEPLSDDDLARLLSGPEPLPELLERACLASLAAGGTDNITAVAARPRVS